LPDHPREIPFRPEHRTPDGRIRSVQLRTL
jgi:hypothetical protein